MFELPGYIFSILISLSATTSLIINLIIIGLCISDFNINSRLASFLLIQLCLVLILYDLSTLPLNLKWAVTLEYDISEAVCQLMGFLLNLAITLFPGAVVFRYAYFYETVVLDRKPRYKLWIPILAVHFIVTVIISICLSATNLFKLRGNHLQCTTEYKDKSPLSIISTLFLIFIQLLAAIIHFYITFSTYHKMSNFNKRLHSTKANFYSPMLHNLKVLRSEASIEAMEGSKVDHQIVGLKHQRNPSSNTAPITPRDVLLKYIPVTIVYMITGLFFISLPMYELVTGEPSPLPFDYAYALVYSIAKFYVILTVIFKNPSILRAFQVGWHYFKQSLRKFVNRI